MSAVPDDPESLANKPDQGEAEVFLDIKVQQDDMLWYYCGHIVLHNPKEPSANLYTGAADEEHVGQVTGGLGITLGAGGVGNTWQNSAKSFLGW